MPVTDVMHACFRPLQGYHDVIRYIGRLAPESLNNINLEGDTAIHLAVGHTPREVTQQQQQQWPAHWHWMIACSGVEMLLILCFCHAHLLMSKLLFGDIMGKTSSNSFRWHPPLTFQSHHSCASQQTEPPL